MCVCDRRWVACASQCVLKCFHIPAFPEWYLLEWLLCFPLLRLWEGQLVAPLVTLTRLQSPSGPLISSLLQHPQTNAYWLFNLNKASVERINHGTLYLKGPYRTSSLNTSCHSSLWFIIKGNGQIILGLCHTMDSLEIHGTWTVQRRANTSEDFFFMETVLATSVYCVCLCDWVLKITLKKHQNKQRWSLAALQRMRWRLAVGVEHRIETILTFVANTSQTPWPWSPFLVHGPAVNTQ